MLASLVSVVSNVGLLFCRQLIWFVFGSVSVHDTDLSVRRTNSSYINIIIPTITSILATSVLVFGSPNLATVAVYDDDSRRKRRLAENGDSRRTEFGDCSRLCGQGLIIM